MKKLRFQALIELYAAREESVRKRLGELEGKRRDVIAYRDHLVAERAGAARPEPRFRDVYSRYWVRMSQAIEAAHATIAAIDGEVEKTRRELIEAHRVHQTFLKLRERDLKELARKRERQEAKLIDELGARRWLAAQTTEAMP
jgi:flagellar export protein FliJ